jgi:peptidoglycan/LPS O-acetylase OafA/YrhL
VDLFFVLSGYLITSILASEWDATGTIRVGGFYWRRFLRLMPPLLLMLAAYLLVAPLVWPAHNHALDALLAALYLSDYSYALLDLPFYLQHTWSLAVEEHYYLVWPLLLPALLRSKYPLIWLTVAWAIITLWRTSYLGDVAAQFRFDTRASGLVLGSALHFIRLKGSRLGAAVGLGAILAAALTATFKWSIIAIPVTELASAALIAGAGTMPFLRNPGLVWVGKLSYGIYLWHFPIAVMLIAAGLAALPVALVTFASSVVLAAISYSTVERSARHLRGRADPSEPDAGISLAGFLAWRGLRR